MKKINKNSPPLRENSPSLRTLFGGQTAPVPASVVARSYV